MTELVSKSLKGFTTADEFLSQQGKREQFEAIAIEEGLEWHAIRAAPVMADCTRENFGYCHGNCITVIAHGSGCGMVRRPVSLVSDNKM